MMEGTFERSPADGSESNVVELDSRVEDRVTLQLTRKRENPQIVQRSEEKETNLGF